MKITVESTDRIVKVSPREQDSSVPARVWEGTTDTGIPVSVLITRIAVERAEDTSQFEQELTEHRPPRVTDVFPLRMVL